MRRKPPAKRSQSPRSAWVSDMHQKIGLPKEMLDDVYSQYIEKARKKRTA